MAIAAVRVPRQLVAVVVLGGDRLPALRCSSVAIELRGRSQVEKKQFKIRIVLVVLKWQRHKKRRKEKEERFVEQTGLQLEKNSKTTSD